MQLKMIVAEQTSLATTKAEGSARLRLKFFFFFSLFFLIVCCAFDLTASSCVVLCLMFFFVCLYFFCFVWRDDSAVFVLFGDYVQQSLSPQRCTQTQTHPHTHTRTTSPTLRRHKDLPKKKRKQRNIEFKKVCRSFASRKRRRRWKE